MAVMFSVSGGKISRQQQLKSGSATLIVPDGWPLKRCGVPGDRCRVLPQRDDGNHFRWEYYRRGESIPDDPDMYQRRVRVLASDGAQIASQGRRSKLWSSKIMTPDL